MSHLSSLWGNTLPRGGAVAGSTPSPTLPYVVMPGNCLATDLPYRLVYVTGDFVSGKIQVATVDPDGEDKMPVRGIIISKESITDCTVLLHGKYAGFSGLVAGKQYWAGADGTLILQPFVKYAQCIGTALSSTVLWFEPQIIYTL